jgi:hypothetical protein
LYKWKKAEKGLAETPIQSSVPLRLSRTDVVLERRSFRKLRGGDSLQRRISSSAAWRMASMDWQFVGHAGERKKSEIHFPVTTPRIMSDLRR